MNVTTASPSVDVGLAVGFEVSITKGFSVGLTVGFASGFDDGFLVNRFVGYFEGSVVGIVDKMVGLVDLFKLGEAVRHGTISSPSSLPSEL